VRVSAGVSVVNFDGKRGSGGVMVALILICPFFVRATKKGSTPHYELRSNAGQEKALRRQFLAARLCASSSDPPRLRIRFVGM